MIKKQQTQSCWHWKQEYDAYIFFGILVAIILLGIILGVSGSDTEPYYYNR